MNKYIALDCETGGLGTDTSLLTVYFAVLDENLDVVDELDLKLRPKDGIYHVQSGGLAVNKINLIEHTKESITYDEGGTVLYNFLNKNNPNGKDKLVPIGCNTAFDIKFVENFLVSRGSWEKFVSYRVQDIAVITRFLRTARKLPDTKMLAGSSVTRWCEYFKIPFNNAHNAKADTLATVAIYKKLLDIVK
jgi:DNA polymerase-3 subunit epsilon